MTSPTEIIDLGTWLQSPAGRNVLAWEQTCMATLVADVFGYHALQLGLPAVGTLTANRMPHRWIAQTHCFALSEANHHPITVPANAEISTPPFEGLLCLPEALPFPDQSLDLVTLPHTLELSQNPHRTLAEVARVLRPEGRILISGINPNSFWAGIHFARSKLGINASGATAILPGTRELIGPGRLRDWLKLLNFEIETIQRGCYRLPINSERWINRLDWMDSAGEKWWPMLGAAYVMVASKRVHGIRLLGLTRTGHLSPAGSRITAGTAQSMKLTPSKLNHHKYPII